MPDIEPVTEDLQLPPTPVQPPTQPTAQGNPGVWLSREEYDRLRGVPQVNPAQPTEVPGQTFEVEDVSVRKNAWTYATAAFAILVFIGFSLPGNMGFLAFLIMPALLVFVILAIVSFVKPTKRVVHTLAEAQGIARKSKMNAWLVVLVTTLVSVAAVPVIGIVALIVLAMTYSAANPGAHS